MAISRYGPMGVVAAGAIGGAVCRDVALGPFFGAAAAVPFAIALWLAAKASPVRRRPLIFFSIWLLLSASVLTFLWVNYNPSVDHFVRHDLGLSDRALSDWRDASVSYTYRLGDRRVVLRMRSSLEDASRLADALQLASIDADKMSAMHETDGDASMDPRASHGEVTGFRRTEARRSIELLHHGNGDTVVIESRF
ncbi:MAG: hypothetical protein WD294_06595 [Phycisphaeraceae bacterium]